MSAPNFEHTTSGFPLYLHHNIYSKCCPECGAWIESTADTCDCCGADLVDISAEYDEAGDYFFYQDVTADCDDLNRSLEFYDVTIESGRYGDFQLAVDFKGENPEELDNEECHYYFDACRSVTLRRLEREQHRLAKRLKAIADAWGFEHYYFCGCYGNGEGIYRPANTLAGKLTAIA